MLRLSTNARTVWVGDLKIENKIGADNQPYVSKSILFRVASNRDYTVNKVVNGVTVKERPSDFIFCKATGSIAQAISDFASAKDVTGKLVSRYLSLHGSLETYTTKKAMQVNATINGQVQAIPFEVEVDQTIFIVKELDFLDSSTKANVATPITTVATTVQTTQPANTVSATVVQPQVTQPPATQAQVNQPVVQPTQATITQPTVSQPTVQASTPTVATATVIQASESNPIEIPEISDTPNTTDSSECPF